MIKINSTRFSKYLYLIFDILDILMEKILKTHFGKKKSIFIYLDKIQFTFSFRSIDFSLALFFACLYNDAGSDNFEIKKKRTLLSTRSQPPRNGEIVCKSKSWSMERSQCYLGIAMPGWLQHPGMEKCTNRKPGRAEFPWQPKAQRVITKWSNSIKRGGIS